MVVPGERVNSSATIGLSKYSSESFKESGLSRTERNVADRVVYDDVVLEDWPSSSELLKLLALSTFAETPRLSA
jgi:hypothetical protein